MRNAEWICRRWLDRRDSRFDLSIPIPHSTLRIPPFNGKELADVKSGLKRMLAFWAPTALAVIGTGVGVLGPLLRR